MAFADPLKEEVAEACGVSIEELEANKAVFRTILQWWGTEFRRHFSGNDAYWIDKMRQTIERLGDIGGELAVITDVRFPNEFNFVKERGGIVVRIESSRCNGGDRHASETALDGFEFDYVISNNGTLDEFRAAVIETVSPFIREHPLEAVTA